MKEENKKQKEIKFNEEEENLLSKYLEEYNDTYPRILILNPLEFFQNILKGLELTMKEKINGFSQESKTKIEEYIIEKIYPSDFKFASFVRKNIKNRNSSEILSHYFKNEILNHCENDKCNGFYCLHKKDEDLINKHRLIEIIFPKIDFYFTIMSQL